MLSRWILLFWALSINSVISHRPRLATTLFQYLQSWTKRLGQLVIYTWSVHSPNIPLPPGQCWVLLAKNVWLLIDDHSSISYQKEEGVREVSQTLLARIVGYEQTKNPCEKVSRLALMQTMQTMLSLSLSLLKPYVVLLSDLLIIFLP